MLKIVFFIFFISFPSLVRAEFIDNKIQQQKIKRGEEIFKKKCVICHGENGYGKIGPALGCHGLKNKSDRYVYENIYYGRNGMHGVDMPSWGRSDFVDEAQKELGIPQILLRKYGMDIVNEYGPMTPEDIKQVILFLRDLEIVQEEKLSLGCKPGKSERLSGNKENGRLIFMEICSKCHGDNGKGVRFFYNQDIKPRDFTDRVYMGSRSDTYLNLVIKLGGVMHGRGSEMDPVNLPDKEINDVISYIRTMSE